MATHASLRWGLLSTAHINQSLIPSIRSSKSSQLLAVASRYAQRAAEYASTWGIPRFHASYEDFLADPDIDIVYISLPNSLHAEWSIKAMQMGKHVLCEKPIAISSKELDGIATVAKETQKVIAEAFMYRHHPQTMLVKEMVDQGEVGNIQLINGSFGYQNTRSFDIRFDPALGGGSLWDVGCYPIGYANYLIGAAPFEVFGHQLSGPTGIDLLYAGQLFYPGGQICQFDCSFISEFKAEIEIIGDKGRLIIPEPYKPGKRTKIFLQKDRQKITQNVKGKELYLGEIEDIENAVLNGSSPRISLEESRQIIQSIEALYLSSRLSKPTRLDNFINPIMEP